MSKPRINPSPIAIKPQTFRKSIVFSIAGLEAIAADEEAPAEAEAVKDTPAGALQSKTNAELREMCSAAGITGVSKKKKDELIAALEAVAADEG